MLYEPPDPAEMPRDSCPIPPPLPLKVATRTAHPSDPETAMTPSTKLGLQTLESREVPAILSGGALWVYGTSGSDTVTVDHAVVGGVAKVKVVENGAASYFDRSAVTNNSVAFYGKAGHDSFKLTHTGLRAFAYGDGGNDTLQGSSQSDYLEGGADSDTILGGGGNDIVWAGEGNDRVEGGSGNDSVFGQGGADRLYGDSGDDTLNGGDQNDYLDGDTGTDTLIGGAGNDGLLGGPGDEFDSVTGGTGQDRFLDWTNFPGGLPGELRTDFTVNEDAYIAFRNTSAQIVNLGSNIGYKVYSPGTWAATEIEGVDNGLVLLQQETGSTKLLRTHLGAPLTFYRAGSTDGDPAGGWNSGNGSITITHAGATTSSGATDATGIKRTTVHEIAHNWDTEQPNAGAWMNLSGWIPHSWVFDLVPPTGMVKSDDGQWWRKGDAQFARTYGKMNPMEDFATCWEAYFGLSGNKVAAKMTHLQSFFDSM
jgi:hypothetical protein